MKYEFSLAAAFIKARKQKWFVNFHTFLSILGITVGVAFLIFALSIYDGYVKKIETIIFSFYPPITLQAPVVSEPDEEEDLLLLEIEDESETCQKICNGVQILEDRTLSATKHQEKQEFALNEFPALKQRLETIPGVTRVSPVIFEESTFTYTYANDNKTITETHPLRFFGVQGSSGKFVPEIDRTITHPVLLKKLDDPGNHHVILSVELYRKLFATLPHTDVVKETTIHLHTGTRDNPRVLELKVVGVFKLGMHNISKNMIITSLATAQEIFSMQEKATFLGASLEKPYQANHTADLVQEAVAKDNYTVFHWLTLASDMFNSLSFYRKIIFILLFMSILITSFNIYNTLNIMILERKQQIGILLSMGVKRKSIYKVFFIISQIEAFAGVVVGLMIGTVMGFLFSDYLNHALEEFLPVQDAAIAIQIGTVTLVMFFVCLLSGLTSFLATRKGASIDPVDALRSE